LKVYLVWYSNPYEYGVVGLEGIFSTEEKAEAHMKKIILEFDYDEQDLTVEEREAQ
jgi:hypothetical protein